MKDITEHFYSTNIYPGNHTYPDFDSASDSSGEYSSLSSSVGVQIGNFYFSLLKPFKNAKGFLVGDVFIPLLEDDITFVNTDDATATEYDIAKGFTAYVKGKKIKGNRVNFSYKNLNHYRVASGYCVFSSTGEELRGWLQPLSSSDVALNGYAGLILIPYSYTTENILVDLKDRIYCDATPSDIIEGKKAYTSAGLITGTMKKFDTITVTPSTSNQTIQAGSYKKITIKGDSNLIGNNIKYGKSIFGVNSNYDFSSVSTLPKENNKRETWKMVYGKTAYFLDSSDSDLHLFSGISRPYKITSSDIINGVNLTNVYIYEDFSIPNIDPIKVKDNIELLGVTGNATYIQTYPDLQSSPVPVEAYMLRAGKTIYVNGEKITGTVPDVGITEENGEIKLDSQGNGYFYLPNDYYIQSNIISSDATLSYDKLGTWEGYDSWYWSEQMELNKTAFVNGRLVTGVIESKNNLTIDPTTLSGNITDYDYILESFTLKGDANFVDSNIKDGVNIWGTTGTYNLETENKINPMTGLWKCISLGSNNNWTGRPVYIYDDSIYVDDSISFEFSYSDIVPEVGKIYNTDATLEIELYPYNIVGVSL